MAKPRISLKKERSGVAKSGLAVKSRAYQAAKNSGKAQNKEKIHSGNHSLNPDRKATSSNMRDRATINRLKMYKNSKPQRDKKGNITKAAPFQGRLTPGTVARVEPNRKWFGNTKIVGQKELQKFQANLGKALADPYQVRWKVLS